MKFKIKEYQDGTFTVHRKKYWWFPWEFFRGSCPHATDSKNINVHYWLAWSWWDDTITHLNNREQAKGVIQKCLDYRDEQKTKKIVVDVIPVDIKKASA